LLKIIDLGLSDPRFPFTAGTPSTMAPEKILKDPSDERSDLYSLGVVFYQLFAGENPFARNDVKGTYDAHLTVLPSKLTLKDPKIPSYWNEIFETLLAKNPAHRYRDAGALLEAIDFAYPARKGREKKALRSWRLERWIGREKIVDKISVKIRESWKQFESGVPHVFLLTGEKGVGKSRIAQEIKYRFQMEKIDVFEGRPGAELLLPHAEEPAKLWILDDWSHFGESEQTQWIHRLEEEKSAPVILITLLPEEAEALCSNLKERALPNELIQVNPFSSEDLREFLLDMMDLKEVPNSFLKGLWEKTHGNPKLVVSLLETLVAQNRLVDARGQWNLAIFKEGTFDLGPLPLDLSQIDQGLVSVPKTDHATRSELWLKRCEELLKKNRIDEASEALQNAEGEAQGVMDLPQKLHFRARIYEKEGWKLIREGHFDEARNRMERALALLEESSLHDEVLSIRIQNFIAWLTTQEGKYDEAITLFEEQERRREQLSPQDQARVLNNELGYAYLLKGDLNRAIFYLEKALELYDRVGDGASQMKGLYNLAEAHANSKNYPKAIQYYLKTAELSRLHRNFELLLRAYNGLGKTYHLQGNYNEGLAYYEKAFDLARYLEDYLSAAAVAQNIGSVQSERGDFDPAEEHFELALKMLAQLSEMNAHAKYLQCRALLERGDLDRKRKRYSEAEGFIRDAHQLSFQESALASFRFWVLYTQCQLERDRGNSNRLQDLMGDLLPLADDAEKRERCRELFQTAPSPTGDGTSKVERTRVEKIQPGLPASSGGGGLEALIRVARWMASEKDPERLLTLIIRQAAELSAAESGIILLEEGKGKMTPRASVNLNLDDSLVQMSGGIAQQVLGSGELVLIGDAQEDQRFRVYESVVDLHLQSILALPIRSQNGLVGVLSLIHRHRPNAFASISLELMQAFADQAGMALENAHLIKRLEEASRKLAQDLDAAEEELRQARRQLSESTLLKRFAEEKLISRNPRMEELFRIIERIRDTDLAVFVHGESGTGKELIARSLHRKSRRSKSPFVAVNCAALPAHLIESELFGYKAGAFTGAVRDKKGLIEEAGGGTLFLDEIGELETSLQAKLLRVLEEKEITRVGDVKPLPVNFRLISASHKNLKEQIALGRFREDLFYRLCEIELKIPPLRERREDIPLLAQEFIDRYLEDQKEKGKARPGRDFLKILLDYRWPGNVRELENVVRVATALRKGSVLHFEDLPESVRVSLSEKWDRGAWKVEAGNQKPDAKSMKGDFSFQASGLRPVASASEVSSNSLFDPQKTWREMEMVVIAKALLLFHFDVKQASDSLGCAVSKLYQRMREYGMEKRKGEFESHPFVYQKGMPLEEIKKEVFQAALKNCQESPYQAARLLKVSPGMVYKWK
jgi:transcriptional regulator with GAF, ATPase, and Fis domain/Tfp pilus assembly protein PilF